jgi:hypothetical protein
MKNVHITQESDKRYWGQYFESHYFAMIIRWNASHIVMNRRKYRDRLFGHINSCENFGRFRNSWKSFTTNETKRNKETLTKNGEIILKLTERREFVRKNFRIQVCQVKNNVIFLRTTTTTLTNFDSHCTRNNISAIPNVKIWQKRIRMRKNKKKEQNKWEWRRLKWVRLLDSRIEEFRKCKRWVLSSTEKPNLSVWVHIVPWIVLPMHCVTLHPLLCNLHIRKYKWVTTTQSHNSLICECYKI